MMKATVSCWLRGLIQMIRCDDCRSCKEILDELEDEDEE
jgi:hypothetical protein